MSSPKEHILTVLVENKPGVLARVAGLFARRGFNIVSLTVAPTDDERFSRITVVVDVESAPLEQVIKQLDKLVNVVKITELAPGDSVEREMLLATVTATEQTRAQIVELVGRSEGRILSAGSGELTVSLDDSPAKVDEFEGLLHRYGIVALQRTGRVALPKLDEVAADPPRP